DLDDVKPSEAAAGGVQTEVVVDRVQLDGESLRRVQQAIETAHARAGRVEVRLGEEAGAGASAAHGEAATHHSLGRGLSCPGCARAFDPPRAGLFSYNNPVGACEGCRGFGRIIAVDWDKVVPDPERTLADNAIKAWAGPSAD